MGQSVSSPARIGASQRDDMVTANASNTSNTSNTSNALCASSDSNVPNVSSESNGPSGSTSTDPSNGPDNQVEVTNSNDEPSVNPRPSPFSGLRLRSRASAPGPSSTNSSQHLDTHTNSFNSQSSTAQEALPASLSAHLASLSTDARGSELPSALTGEGSNRAVNRRRRRRLSSNGSDEPAGSGGPKRQNRSSLQRLRDTVMSPFANSISSTSATNTAASSHEDNNTNPVAFNASTSNPSSFASTSSSASSSSSSSFSSADSRQNWPSVSGALSRGRNLLRAPSLLRPGRSISAVEHNNSSNSTSQLASLISNTNSSVSQQQQQQRAPRQSATTSSQLPEGSSDNQAALLSRLLAVAATVTANTLVNDSNNQSRGFSFGGGGGGGYSGDNHDNPNVSGPNEEGSFRGFLDRLQRGMLASELSSSLDESGHTRNFFRMFRFPPSTHSGDEDLIPVLIVGVRAVEGLDEGIDATAANSGSARDTAGGGRGGSVLGDPVLDALSSRPMMFRDTNHTRLGRRAREAAPIHIGSQDRSALWPPSEDAAGAAGSTGENGGGHSINATNEFTNRLTEALENSRTSTNNDAILDDIFSGLSSGRRQEGRAGAGDSNSNPNYRRPHSLPSSRSSSASSLASESTHAAPSEGVPAGNAASSDSGNRRESRQSWIVYVVGGSYPRNHPILLAPSLFTEHPSYEDLLVLENFLGQEKPPVATKDDIAKAGGIVYATDIADGSEGSRVKHDKCLVCLSEYESGDVCRKLNDCGHLFHRECIDQWLTTGKNSCPLCRAKGVASTASSDSTAAPANSTE